MASILDRYGIKEVADVTFYELDGTGKPTKPVLYLDTLKVSTIEQTAETSEARGGKGNAALISWDYGKEINVTLEDALFSAKSMAIMFGNGLVKTYNENTSYVMRTEQFVATGTTVPYHTSTGSGSTLKISWASRSGWSSTYVGPNGRVYEKYNPKFYDASGKQIPSTQPDKTTGKFPDGTPVFEADQTYFCTYDLKVAGSIIDVSADSFPGTYYVTGDTYARSDASGRDEFFQFIIPKGKVQSENTITLEAEGDPSVFNMSLKVLRPADGVMMKLVKYDLAEGTDAAEESVIGTMYHNHVLEGTNIETMATPTSMDL